MPQEFSIGIVMYSGDEFLIMQYTAGHWGFVKGKPEGEETFEETARRELEEETGIKVVFFAKDFKETEKYFFKRFRQTVYKEVNYLLGETPEIVMDIKLSKEHQGFKWLGFEEAMATLTFKETKNVLKEAHDYMKLHGRI